MKAIELLQYLKDGMDVGYPPKHIINNAIKEIKELEALIEDNSKGTTCKGCSNYRTKLNEIDKNNLMTTLEYTELGICFQKNMLNLAGYLLNRCYVVFHNNKILGVYPKWDYTVESIRDIFKDEPFKDEIRITMYYKVVGNEVRAKG